MITVATASTVQLGAVRVDGTSIVINEQGQISSRGGAVSSRTVHTATSQTLAPGAHELITITGYLGYNLYSIETSHAAWVTVYTNTASRLADLTRNSNSDPISTAGVVCEVITRGSETVYISPAAAGYSAETVPSLQIPVKVENTGLIATAITVTLTLVKTEV